MSSSLPNIMDTVFIDNPVLERRASERQRADSKDNLNASTVKEMEDLEMGEEDQNSTPYDNKLITSCVPVSDVPPRRKETNYALQTTQHTYSRDYCE